MSTRDERVEDLFIEPLVGNPTEEGQVRNVGTDIVAFINGSVKSLTTGATPSGTGQVLISLDGVSYSNELPLTSDDGWLVTDSGLLMVCG